ncbi:MAG: NusG domain II-containing protein [Thiobacillaceae bacterium]|jgi:hypothetical protein
MIAYFKVGDWAVLTISSLMVCALVIHAWTSPRGERALVRAGGQVFAELNLSRDGSIKVPGPLGQTRIEITQHKVRIASDPGPRQLCVKQGWLSHVGQAALCLPNQVSVEITGASRPYDSLNY